MKEKYTIKDNREIKSILFDGCNIIYNKIHDSVVRWGKNVADNPTLCKYGPDTVEIEVSTKCSNCCSHCYKSCNKDGSNMSLEAFKCIVDKLPDTVCRISLGIGDIDSNKSLFEMMDYCVGKGITPVITINGKRMTSEYYDLLSQFCGSVSVSLYDYDVCYNAVKELTDRNANNVTINCIISEYNYGKCIKALKDMKYDTRLSKAKAIIFKTLKPEGRGFSCKPIKSIYKLKHLVDIAIDHKIKFGFDSCSAGNFVACIIKRENRDALLQTVEPCTSSLFSYYINVAGLGFPCGFSEHCGAYFGIDVLNCDNFLEDVWHGKETEDFRGNLINGCRLCPNYDIQLVRMKL